MRKVLYKKWIPTVYDHSVSGVKTTVHGTGCFQKDFATFGLFHQWGVSYEEFENGPGNYTVAIVENEDGTISEVLPVNIKFIS